MPITKSACFDVQFVLRCSCKGTTFSTAISLANAMDCVLLTVVPKCLNWWGHIPSFFQPHSRPEKPARTEQQLDWVYIILLDMVYSDVWMYSHLSQLNIFPHLSSILFPFLSHAYPYGVWALLSTWLTTIVMDYHLPGCECALPLSTHHPQWLCLDTSFCWYHQLPLSILRTIENPPIWAHCYGYWHPAGGGINRSHKWRYYCGICIKTPYLLWNGHVLQNNSHEFLSLLLQICMDGLRHQDSIYAFLAWTHSENTFYGGGEKIYLRIWQYSPPLDMK